MRLRPHSGPVERDWFGLDAFLPGPRFTRDGGSLYLLEEVGSTNDFLRGRGEPADGRLCRWDGWGWVASPRARLAPVRELAPGTVVVARRQSGGRGRQGRQWVDCGGLHLSVSVPRHRAAFNRGFSVWLGLIVTLVLREGERVDARLKWPNDIVVDRRKLGGILLERADSGGGAQVAAGLGLNLGGARHELPWVLRGTATSLAAEGGRVPRLGDLCARLLGRVEAELDRFCDDGSPAYRPALELLDCLLGQRVRLVTRQREFSGRAVGIDDQGALLVEREGTDGALTVEAIRAGDVHLLPPPPPGGDGAGAGPAD
ncbi:biotin--[acetyl-CoA-carboxylase] ligase [bacterium]|nr:biotin--[acetyl-CoA-carboxylase] ligase [bacterium]